MVIRDARLEDGTAVGRVWVEAWQTAYAGLMSAEFLAGLDPTDCLARFEHALRAGVSILVLEQETASIGFSVFGPSRDSDAGSQLGEVMAINLAPSCWRRGFGQVLLRETVERLRRGRFTELTLWVVHANDRARKFYEAQGWRQDGAEKHDDSLTGFPLHEVRYRLPLSMVESVQQ